MSLLFNIAHLCHHNHHHNNWSVIFVLVQIAVCKCHLKFDQQEGRGRCMSMQVDGGVAVSDLPIWRLEQEEEARGHIIIK